MPSLTMADAASRSMAKKWSKPKKTEAAGESVKEFAKKVSSPNRLARQGRLAETRMSMRKGKGSHDLYEKK